MTSLEHTPKEQMVTTKTNTKPPADTFHYLPQQRFAHTAKGEGCTHVKINEVKYETEQLREEARLAALERMSINAKKKYAERKKNEKVETVEEWFVRSQSQLHADKKLPS